MKGGLINLLALIVLITILWVGGHFFEIAIKWRVLATIIVLVLWMLIYLWQRMRAVRTARLIEKRLRDQAAEQIASSRPAERDQLEDLERRLKEAMHALSKSKLGKAALAELPWYIFIGPPGSGKSTALQESGLEFPQAGQGLNGVQGFGGTRNCEWWFTTEGILIDTAGRYTTVAEDREEWLSFLGMIKESRNRKPINGAIVALAISDLVAADQAELEEHAKAVRERLDELCQNLEEVFPVYLVFTKCDLMAGFVEFFESFNREEREQVWGYTFPYETFSAERYKSTFLKESAALYERLTKRRLKLLAVDAPPDKLQRLYSFPLQFSACHDKLAQFIQLTFRENPFNESPILRGFYYTSGTQEGRPIDQVLGAMRQAFGLNKQEEAAPDPNAPPADPNLPPPPPAMPEPVVDKKSYFLTSLFRKLIFPDRQLARSLAKTELRRRVTAMATIAGSVLFTLLLLVAMGISFFGNRALVSRVGVGVKAVHDANASDRTSASVRLAALEQLRPGVTELSEHDDSITGAPIMLSFGLYEGDELVEDVREIYFKELTALLLGPCIKGLEAELERAAKPDVDVNKLKKEYGYDHDQEFFDGLYRMLRVYMMLGNKLEANATDIKDLLKLRNRWMLGMGVKPGQKTETADDTRAWAQFDFLMTQLEHREEWSPPVDSAIIDRVKKKLEANYWVSQSYTLIRDTRKGQAGEDTLKTLFPDGHSIFAPLPPITKVFSQSEWDEYFERAIGEKSAYLAEQYAEMKTKKDEAQIKEELRGYYEADGRTVWSNYLESLKLAPYGGINGAAKRLDLLGSPRSPLPKVFDDIWLRQFVLDADAQKLKLVQRDPPRKPENDETIPSWHVQVQDTLAQLAKAYEEAAKNPVGERFWKRAMGNQLGELDPLRAAFSETKKQLYDWILPQVPEVQESFARLIFDSILARAHEAIIKESQAEANAFWKDQIFDVYQDKCSGRYPFKADATDETPLPETGELFNPVDGMVWQAKAALGRLNAYEVGGKGLIVLGPRYGRSIKSAERLRDALFDEKAKDVGLKLKIKLVKRPDTKDLRFSLGETSFKLSEMPPGTRKEVLWGDKPGSKLSLLVTQQDQWAHKDFTSNPWALLRLLDDGKLDLENTKDRNYRYTWTFNLGGEGEEADERLGDVDFEIERNEAGPIFRKDLFTNIDGPPDRVDQ